MIEVLVDFRTKIVPLNTVLYKHRVTSYELPFLLTEHLSSYTGTLQPKPLTAQGQDAKQDHHFPQWMESHQGLFCTSKTVCDQPLYTLLTMCHYPVWGTWNMVEGLEMKQTDSRSTKKWPCCSTFPQVDRQQHRHNQHPQGMGEWHSILQQILAADSGQWQAQGRTVGYQWGKDLRSMESKMHL